MQNKNEEIYIARCCREIENKLGWGDAESWSNQDFENLSDIIRDATGITLSTSTLKRIWGKVKYDSVPAITTLNTLAQFIGYDNWRSFKQSSSAEPIIPQKEGAVIPNQPSPAIIEEAEPKTKQYVWFWLGLGAIIFIGILGFYFAGKKVPAPTPMDVSKYEFTSKKVITEGVPNSVIFDYDASASPTDSVFIQQSWDKMRREAVSKNQHQHTSIYFYPGIFRAKLVIGDQVVKQHDLMITTKGWLPMVIQHPIPVYFDQKDADSNDGWGLSPDKLKEKNISLQPQPPTVLYSNVGNWGDIKTDHFRFEAELKNDYKEGSAACQYAQIFLLGQETFIAIPLCNKGCISDLSVRFLNKTISGKEKDLSALGVDFSKWVKLVCEVQNQQARIYVNDNLAFEMPVTSEPVNIVGVNIAFQGTGRMKNVKLTPI